MSATTIRETCDMPGCAARSEKMRQWPNGERAFTCVPHAAGLDEDAEAPIVDVPRAECEVCGRSSKSAKRCEFGARSGPCSCWRGVACGSL